MIYTARQLESLLKVNGKVVLPCGARLTPLARDWVRLRSVVIGYADVNCDPVKRGETQTESPVQKRGTLLWWCDGASGVSKAALMSVAREVSLAPLEISSDSNRAIGAVKHLKTQVKSGAAEGGILVVANGATAMIAANRTSVLRAVLGTTQMALEQAINDLAPNVLVLEDARQTLQQARNLILRFARGNRTPSETLQRELKELAS